MSYLDPLFNMHTTLQQHGCEPSMRNGHTFKSRCPVPSHGKGGGDKNPSLSVAMGQGGRLVMKCHAGCTFDEICDALGIHPSSLAPENDLVSAPACSSSRDKQPVRDRERLDDPHLQASTGIQSDKPNKQIEAVYPYRDDKGTLLFEVVRYKPKGFRQRRPDPDRPGKYVWNMDGVVPVPFNLPAILAERDKSVLIVEGEKDVDTLTSLGYLATTSPMGAGKWKASYSKWLAGRKVYILQDSDEVGAKHAKDIASSLAGVAANVYLVPPFEGFRDVTDWCNDGHLHDDLAACLFAAKVQPPVEQKPDKVADETAASPRVKGSITLGELLAMDLPEPEWIVPGMLCEGLAILAGQPKAGKSWLSLSLAIATAGGGSVLGIDNVPQGRVKLMALEDTFKRLLDRSLFLSEGQDCPMALTHLEFRLEPEPLDELDLWLTDNPDCKLVIIDTFGRYRDPQQRGSNLYDHDTKQADVLQKLAFKHHICLLLIHHTRKETSEGNPLAEVSGSFGLPGVADTVMVLKSSGNNDNRVGTLHVTGRDVEENQYRMRMVTEDVARATGTVPGWVIDKSPVIEAATPERRDLLKLLTDADRPMQLKEIAEGIGKSVTTVQKTLRKLIQTGDVYQPARGQYTLYAPPPPVETVDMVETGSD
jgi:AAA domain/IclR helix-turn-helix domain